MDLTKFTVDQLDKMYATIMPSSNPIRDEIATEIERRVESGKTAHNKDGEYFDENDDEGPIAEKIKKVAKTGKKPVKNDDQDQDDDNEDVVEKAISVLLSGNRANTFEKGGKRAVVGERRQFNGKWYEKVASGWRPIPKIKLQDLLKRHDDAAKIAAKQAMSQPEVKNEPVAQQGLNHPDIVAAAADEPDGFHQAISNVGYDAWQSHEPSAVTGRPVDSYQDMVDHVQAKYGDDAAFAVLLGKYNQQVENGGHYQYHDNGYAGTDGRDEHEMETHQQLRELAESTGFYDYLNIKRPDLGNRLKGILDRFQDIDKDTERYVEEWVEQDPEYDDDGEEIEGTGSAGYEDVDNEEYGQIDQHTADKLDDEYYAISGKVMQYAEQFFKDKADGTFDPQKKIPDYSSMDRGELKKRRSQLVQKLVSADDDVPDSYKNNIKLQIDAIDEAYKIAPPGVPKLKLTGQEGNIFSIIGRFGVAAQEAGWNRSEIKKVQTEMTSAGSYDAALGVAMNVCDIS